MNFVTFVTITGIGSIVSALFTEAIKKWYANAGKNYSANTIALVDAIAVGGIGTAVVYLLAGIPWTINNIVCLGLMVITVWIGSMIGYDKLTQTFKQIADLKPVDNTKK